MPARRKSDIDTLRDRLFDSEPQGDQKKCPGLWSARKGNSRPFDLAQRQPYAIGASFDIDEPIQNKSRDRSPRMSIDQIFFLSVIASAFLTFAAVLAWGDYQTRHIARRPSTAQRRTAPAVAIAALQNTITAANVSAESRQKVNVAELAT